MVHILDFCPNSWKNSLYLEKEMTFNVKIPYDKLPLLPPPQRNIESINIWRQESIAREALAELKGIANIIHNPAILINALILREAKDSSEIENVLTKHDELYRALSSEKKLTDPQTKEVIRYRESLFKGYKLIKKKNVLSPSDIINIQETIVLNNAGIRKSPGTALRNERTDEIIYTPPQNYERIQKLINNYTEFFNDDETSLIRMAILHYQFECIHPFYDGNGRAGRILNILYLILKGLLDIPILYLSSYIIKEKDMYYRYLLDVTQNEKWENWILFMLKGVEETSKDTIVKINNIKRLLDKMIEEVKLNASHIYSKELIEILFENPYGKINFLVKGLGVERKAASRYLKKLQDIGILELIRVGRENIYINKQLFQILKN
jgi:Fic family protein